MARAGMPLALFFTLCLLGNVSFVLAGLTSWNNLTLSSSPENRRLHSAVMNDAGRIWIFAGIGTTSGTFFNDIWYIDTQVANATWNQLSATNAPLARSQHVAVLSKEGRMWMFGGQRDNGWLRSDLWYIDVEAASPQWTQARAHTGAGSRKSPSAVLTASGKRMYLFGGEQGGVHNDLRYFDLEAASPDFVTVSPNGTLPTARTWHTAVVDGNDVMWVFGGSSSGGYLNDLWRIDLQASSPTWEELTPSAGPSARRDHTAVISSTGRMVIFGGTDGVRLNDAWYIDLRATSLAWTQLNPVSTAPPTRKFHRSVLSSKGEMWTVGGDTGELSELWYAEALSPEWLEVSATGPVGRWSASAVLDPYYRMWVWGGYDGTSYYSDLWFLLTEAESPSWYQVYPSGNISSREGHSAVISSSGTMWVFGGNDNGSPSSSVSSINLQDKLLGDHMNPQIP